MKKLYLPPFTETIPASELPEERPLASGVLICSGMLTVSFTGIVTIAAAGAGADEERRALLGFVGSLPLLASYVVAAVDYRGRYAKSRVLEWLPLFGVLLSFAGLATWVGSLVPGVGTVLTLLSFGVVYVFYQSEERMKRRRQGAERKRASR